MNLCKCSNLQIKLEYLQARDGCLLGWVVLNCQVHQQVLHMVVRKGWWQCVLNFSAWIFH